MKFQLRSVALAFPIAAVLACSAPDEGPGGSDASDMVAVEAEERGEPATEIEICDENGNRYPSEDAAKEAGLDEAQYGATYCQYFE